MKWTGRIVLAALAVLVLLCTAASATSIQKCISLCEVWNRTGQDANDFHLLIGGISVADLDPNGYCDSDYSKRTVFQDFTGVHIYWEDGSTPNGASDLFGFTVRGAVTLTSVLAQWTQNGMYIATLDDVWQDWTVINDTIGDTINNRSGGDRWIQRTAGSSPTPVTIQDLIGMPSPPNPIPLDQSPIRIGNWWSLLYVYTQAPGTGSYFMFYDLYSDQPSPNTLEMRFRNAAVVGSPLPPLALEVSEYATPYLFWYPKAGQNPYIAMLGFNASTSSGCPESVLLRSIRLQPWDAPWDSGNNPADIASVDVWIDANSNGEVDAGTDTHVGQGVYTSDDVPLTLTLTPAQTIAPGGTVPLLISYTLTNPPPPVGTRHGFSVNGVDAVGASSGQPADIQGLWIDSGEFDVVPPPITIGQAKKLPINPASGMSEVFLIENVPITANFQSTMGLAYMQNESAGIGVLVTPEDEIPPVGAVVSVYGRLKLLDNAELVMTVDNGSDTGRTLIVKPRGMNNKSTGGGVYGSQPAVIDDAPTGKAAVGLNNVGMLVKIWGTATGLGQVTIGGQLYNAVRWRNDGSNLNDGWGNGLGIAVLKPPDWIGDPPSGMVAVTGIMRAIPNPAGMPVRVLVPRGMADVTWWPFVP